MRSSTRPSHAQTQTNLHTAPDRPRSIRSIGILPTTSPSASLLSRGALAIVVGVIAFAFRRRSGQLAPVGAWFAA
jgi:hypothetical protein